MQWYYAENGEQIGPIEEPQLHQMVAAGQLTPETLVWRAGMAEWSPYGEALPEKPEEQADSAGPESASCRECGTAYSTNEMVPYLGSYVCANCKPIFFQQIQEGTAPSGGGEGTSENVDIMARARSVLANNWGPAIGICIIYFLISFGINFVGGIMGGGSQLVGGGLSNILQIFLLPPFLTGITAYFIILSREENPEVGLLTYGFKRYWTSVGGNFFRSLILGGVALLLIIPIVILIGVAAAVAPQSDAIGIAIAMIVVMFVIGLCVVMTIVGYMLQMTFYVIADDDQVNCFEALGRSRQMMKGMKWKFFCLNLRFIGWSFLSMFTLGIGLIWLAPYMAATWACFYEDVRGRVHLD